jgi:hypothetical protein
VVVGASPWPRRLSLKWLTHVVSFAQGNSGEGRTEKDGTNTTGTELPPYFKVIDAAVDLVVSVGVVACLVHYFKHTLGLAEVEVEWPPFVWDGSTPQVYGLFGVVFAAQYASYLGPKVWTLIKAALKLAAITRDDARKTDRSE